MTETPNHGYNVPERGAKDWDIQLNDNFSDIDADIEIRGTEADKRDYKPKEGTKFEAIDSGAVYHGDGENWILTDRQTKSLCTDKYYTVPEGTIQDIADAITTHRYVKLEPGATYTASSEVRVEKDSLQEDTYVDARGAVLTSTASEAVFHFWKTARCAGGNANCVTWRGGTIVGAGKSPDSTGNSKTDAGIRITDCFRHDIKLGTAVGVDKGIHARNDECWSEALNLGYLKDGGYEGYGSEGDMNFCVYMEGARATGGTGTASFRSSRVEIPYGSASADDGEGNAFYYLDAGSMHGGYLNVEGFLPDDGYLIYSNGGLNDVIANIECEGGNEASRAIVHDDGPAPLYVNPRIGGHGTLVENNISGPIPALRRLDLVDLGEKKIIDYDWGNNKVNIGYPITAQGPKNNYSGNYFIGKKDGEKYVALGKGEDDAAELRNYKSGRPTRSYNAVDEATVEHVLRGAHYDTKRSDPTAEELESGESMTYVSDGSTTGDVGDLVRAYNDEGQIKTQVIAALADAT